MHTATMNYNYMYIEGVTPALSICESEILAIKKAVTVALLENCKQNVIIFTDLQSAIQRLMQIGIV